MHCTKNENNYNACLQMFSGLKNNEIFTRKGVDPRAHVDY